MALLYNIPHSDNLLCAHITCREKAEAIIHFKDKSEKFYCTQHYLDVTSAQEMAATVNRIEKLRVPGERNK